MEEIEDPGAYRVGTGKENGRVMMVGSVGGMRGGSKVGISSPLVGSVAFAHKM